MGEIAGEIGSAYVRIRPNMASFEAETLSGVKSTFKKVAATVGVAYGATELFKFGKESITDAANVQKSQELIRAEFGKSGAALTKWADEAGIKLGVTSHESESTAARFGVLFHNMGIGQAQAATMTLNLEKLAGSLAAARGMDPTAVFERLPIALAGNVRGLKQLGISIDATAIKQEAVALGFTHTTGAANASSIAQERLAIAQAQYKAALDKYGSASTQAETALIHLQTTQAKATAGVKEAVDALTPAQRAQVIYALATKNLGDAQKNAAAHSGDYANVTRRLSAEWDHARETLGAGLLPVLAKYGGELAKWMDNMEKSGALERDLKSISKDVATVFQEVASAVHLGYVAFHDVTGAVGGVKNAFIALLAAMSISKIASFFSTMSAGWKTAGREAVLSSQMAQGASREEAAVYLAGMGEMEVATVGLGATMKAALISTGIGAVVVAIGIGVAEIIQHWSTVKRWLEDFAGWMQTAFRDALDVVKGLFYGFVASVVGELKLLADGAAKALGWLPGIGGKLKAAAATVDSWYTEFKNKSLASFADIGTSSANAFAGSYISTLTAQQAAMAAAAGVTGNSASDVAASPGRSSSRGSGQNVSTSALKAMVLSVAKQYGIPTGVALAQIQQESGFNPLATSPAGAAGIAQFITSTAAGFGLTSQQRYNPALELQAYGKYMSRLIAKYGLAGALSAYNSGSPTAYQDASFAKGQTYNYVKNILAAAGVPVSMLSSTAPPAGTTPSTVPGLTVGTSTAKMTAVQVAAAKKSLDASYAVVLDTIRKNGIQVRGTIKTDMDAARKDISTVATAANVTDARSQLAKLRLAVTDEVQAMKTHLSLMNTFDGLKRDVAKLGPDVTPQIKQAMTNVRAEIEKAVTPQSVTKVKQQMQALKTAITTEATAIKQQADLIKSAFEGAFSRVASAADSAFQKATAAAVKAMQVTVSVAGQSFLFGGSVTQTPAQVALQQLQDAHDATQAADQLAADQQALRDAQATGDAAQIKQAQATVDNDLYQAKVTALQKQANLESSAAAQQLSDAQQAYQDSRTLLQQQLDDRVSAIELGMENGTIAATDGMNQLMAVFNDPTYGIDVRGSALVLAGNLYQGLDAGLKPVFALFDQLAKKMRELGLLPNGDNSSGPPPPTISRAHPATLPGGLVVPGTGTIDDIVAAINGGTDTSKQMLNELKVQTMAVTEPGRIPGVGLSVAR